MWDSYLLDLFMILEEGRFEPSVYVWGHLSILFSLNIESDAP